MKKETLDKYIGLTVGCLTVIELDHETYDKEKQSKRSYFKCKCNRCGKYCNIMKNKFDKDLFLQKIEQIYHNFHNESSTTISKESTSEANADGNGEFLNAA